MFQSSKARLMIILSGFTVSVADEVKSRTNAFKVYHMGTMFYFAAETPDDLSMWLDWFSTATIADGHNSSKSNLIILNGIIYLNHIVYV